MKGILIIVKQVGTRLSIIKEDFRKDSKELLRDFFDFVPKQGEGIALIAGNDREKYMYKGIQIPIDIKTSIPF